MPGYHVNKGPFAFLDTMFDGTNPQAYKDAKTKLAGSLQAAAVARFGAGDPKVQHLQNDWLGTGGGSYHWSPLKPEETLRAGLTNAITAAQGTDENHPKPMEFFWVCSNDRAFHVYYSDGRRQVTVIVFTPAPMDAGGQPTGAPGTPTTPDGIWVVKKQDYETTPAGQNYPGPITTEATIPPPIPATIIKRQIYS